MKNALEIINIYLLQKKLQEKASCDDYILSLSEALKHIHQIMKNEIEKNQLVNIISKEALKHGMIIHFDNNKVKQNLCKKIS